MRIVRTKQELSDLSPPGAPGAPGTTGAPDRAGCVLVPTMGGLHEGHAALVRTAAGVADEQDGQRPLVVVSVFVNPTQFNVPSDYERYPRTLDADAALCERAGADAVFAPDVETVYPPGEVSPAPALPDQAVGRGLEDAHRPGHFAGVCQVVRRLFELCAPSAAVFGEKDWQQLQVVRAMVRGDLSPSVRRIRIVPCPTVREHDGLAMSSRNRFLSDADRARAVALSQALCDASTCATVRMAEEVMRERLLHAGARIDYAEVVDAESLLALPGDLHADSLARPARAILAARFGDDDREVRLLDNAPWPAPAP